MHQEANALLKELSCIDYAGNVEGRDIMAATWTSSWRTDLRAMSP